MGPCDIYYDPLAPVSCFSILEDAVKSGDLQSIRDSFPRIKEERGTDLEIFSWAILPAVELERLDIIETMITELVPLDGRVMRKAVECSSTKCLDFLLRFWDINRLLGIEDTTVLGYAVENEKLAEWLLDRGADPNAENAADYTPLSAAAYSGDTSAVAMLVRRGGDVKRGQLLHHACRGQNVDAALFEFLCQAGAPVHQMEYANNPAALRYMFPFCRGTPLSSACANQNETAVRIFLERGADPWKLNSRGETPLDVARKRGNLRIQKLLLPYCMAYLGKHTARL